MKKEKESKAKEREKKLHCIRHSLSHLLAAAVLEKWPQAKLAIGPVIENGFYYDFDFNYSSQKRKSAFPQKVLTEEDLPQLEKRMRELAQQNLCFIKEKISYPEAKKIFADAPYKLELIEEIHKKKLPLSIYKTITCEKSKNKNQSKGNLIFLDLCSGPHVKNTREINPQAFKLTTIAGAYWRGDEKNKMLTRIYGVAFETKEELETYLKNQEEAQKRDHRKLGKELKIFTFSDFVGPGLPLWLPNGAILIEELEKLAKEKEEEAGYLRVRTPHIAKEIMYKTSGHLPYYADSMYPPMVLEENGKKEVYYLKAMNCPHHHQIYASEPRSYRDLPLRLAEYGTCYRYEKSGELFGLMRVRSLQMNDAHIYCTEEQFQEEFLAVIKMYLEYFKIFDIKKYVIRLSTHSKEGLGKKYIDNERLWKKTEKMVRDILKKENIPFIEVPNEAAFYGPKIDVEIWSAIGKEFTLATNQVDFAVPARFGLTYKDKDGKEKTPLCIHRAPLSTHERLIGFLIEHYAGAFPLWLAPTQVEVLPVSEKHSSYAQKIAQQMKEERIRVRVSESAETLGKRIRQSEIQKIPYLLIVGDKEKENNSVNVRSYQKGQLGEMKLEAFIKKALEEIRKRAS
ncbi:MAG: threonine--tRNA ligase [Candidatus Parcubacteria bacterium]|nr:threonine--tRNA ligase [Patescibacteria group bacterium]BCX16241.1 MAG: threonine--tRNA ligase [Candidatus Parcubacteria bacterium]